MSNKLKDSLERVFYTLLSGLGATGAVAVTELETVWVPVALVLVNGVLLWLRRKIGMLPSPGQGLPGARIR